ncbi:hypothetical protein evm_014007 [Chilo suppressalis]|nr:hypothetical protein evm_014007 [Chilo suppressalis]
MEIHKYMDNFPALKCSDGYRLSAAEVLLTNLHNKENYFQRGLPLGPQLFAVSPDEDNITECFLIINDTMYNIDSPLKAFDIFFKLFHALNCCYPKQTERELYFLQRAVYKIQCRSDKQIRDSKTEGLINEYNRYKPV